MHRTHRSLALGLFAAIDDLWGEEHSLAPEYVAFRSPRSVRAFDRSLTGYVSCDDRDEPVDLSIALEANRLSTEGLAPIGPVPSMAPPPGPAPGGLAAANPVVSRAAAPAEPPVVV